MADGKLIEVAKKLVAVIEDARRAGTFEMRDFDTDWEVGGRVQLRQRQSGNLPEEWLLRGDRLQVRVMVPRRYEEIDRHDRDSLSWVAAWDIDIRQKLSSETQESSQAISRDELSKRVLLVEQLFEATGPDLDEAERKHRRLRVRMDSSTQGNPGTFADSRYL